MAILAFSDVHLGIKSYSTYNQYGASSAEVDSIKALMQIMHRTTETDIDMVICAGDLFHTNHPTSANVEFMIQWLTNFNRLEKPLYLIPGNHDVSQHSHSMAFIDDLKLEYIHLIEQYDPEVNFKWHDWNIVCVPYEISDTNQDKDGVISGNLNHAFETASDKTIIVTHVHERNAKIGSEGMMLSRKVDNFDMTEGKNVILLTGHIHRQQMYHKGADPMVGKTVVVYPGSTTYMDAGDLNMNKGYAIIGADGSVTFEDIPGIRQFVKYELLNNEDPVEFFSGMRMPPGQVVFLDYNCEVFNESQLRDVLGAKGNTLGWAKRVRTRNGVVFSDTLISTDSNASPYEQLKTRLELDAKEGRVKTDLVPDLLETGNAMIQGLAQEAVNE